MKICERINFKSVQHATITKMYKLSLDAVKKYSKFLSFIEKVPWPIGMESTRANLLP